MKLSIVSPIYKGEKMLDELVGRITTSVKKITDDYEIILVNDQSPDNSWEVIKRICMSDKHVRGVNLSRNFGQHYAITAGMTLVQGDWIVVMDCDLQDRPEEIPNLYAKAKEGYDIVYAQRQQRQDKYLKRLSSSAFHAVFDWLSGMKSDKSISNFGIYSAQVISEYNKMPERARSFVPLIEYLGFNKGYLPVVHAERAEGTSGYNFSRLMKLAFDVMISNTNKPLKMAVELGLIMAFCSFVLAIYNVLAKFVGIISVEGYTTTVFSIWFVGGILLMMMGVLGLYIDKIFDQVKGRQLFVIKEILN